MKDTAVVWQSYMGGDGHLAYKEGVDRRVWTPSRIETRQPGVKPRPKCSGVVGRLGNVMRCGTADAIPRRPYNVGWASGRIKHQLSWKTYWRTDGRTDWDADGCIRRRDRVRASFPTRVLIGTTTTTTYTAGRRPLNRIDAATGARRAKRERRGGAQRGATEKDRGQKALLCSCCRRLMDALS